MFIYSNLFKLLVAIGVFCAYTVSVYEYGRHTKEVEDDVVSMKQVIANQNDSLTKTQIAYHQESIKNDNLTDQINAIMAEHDYDTQTILKYQKTINAKSHIDNSFVRVMENINSSAVPSATGLISATVGANDQFTATGILLYQQSLREYAMTCKDKYNTLLNQYNDTATLYNSRAK